MWRRALSRQRMACECFSSATKASNSTFKTCVFQQAQSSMLQQFSSNTGIYRLIQTIGQKNLRAHRNFDTINNSRLTAHKKKHAKNTIVNSITHPNMGSSSISPNMEPNRGILLTDLRNKTYFRVKVAILALDLCIYAIVQSMCHQSDIHTRKKKKMEILLECSMFWQVKWFRPNTAHSLWHENCVHIMSIYQKG